MTPETKKWKAKVFVKKTATLGKNIYKYRVGFTIGVQTFFLNMGSNGIRPKKEAIWYKGCLESAFKNMKP